MLDGAIKSSIFNLIALHDGQWYWYHVERALSTKRGYEHVNSLDYVKALVAEGLMELRQSCGEAGDRYWLTSKGVKHYKNKNASDSVRTSKSEN